MGALLVADAKTFLPIAVIRFSYVYGLNFLLLMRHLSLFRLLSNLIARVCWQRDYCKQNLDGLVTLRCKGFVCEWLTRC